MAGDTVYDNTDYWGQKGTNILVPSAVEVTGSAAEVFDKVMFDNHKPNYELTADGKK